MPVAILVEANRWFGVIPSQQAKGETTRSTSRDSSGKDPMTAIVPNSPISRAESSRTRAAALYRDVLLASDGSPAAFAATRLVGKLASERGITPFVVTVVPPPQTIVDPVGASFAFGATLAEQLRYQVHHQLELSSLAAASRETLVGSPSAEILRVAEDRGSDLIVLGLRPHALLDRVFRDETALSVMRHAKVPVLAITRLESAPRRVAVAIDFSRASIAAARAALALVDDGGSLQLVYVEPPLEPATEATEGFNTIYAQGVAAAFGRLRQELATRPNVTVETVVLHGNVVAELQSFVARAEIDLLALGSQRHSITRRAFVGGVTTALARLAPCSLLVLPPNRRA
jgi:nucleotide-binding universal stress UspA family protein